jgi:hypothetical protein
MMPFDAKNASFYRDRLGTDIGKALKTVRRFSLAGTNAGYIYIFQNLRRLVWGASTKRSLFEFSLCLSRACLGKMSIFIYKCSKKDRFRVGCASSGFFFLLSELFVLLLH